VCEAQTMKPQLNDTGQIFRHFFIMGIATKKDIFIHFLRFGLNSLTYAKVQNLKQNKRKIVFFTMIMPLRRRATVGLVQRAVLRKRRCGSSDTLCRTAPPALVRTAPIPSPAASLSATAGVLLNVLANTRKNLNGKNYGWRIPIFV
jgi:hypothetical protein